MIVIGTIELKFTKGSGTFCCPQCDQERTYRQRTRRLFLTVYFIPLIPLQTLGEFIECTTCHGTFPVESAALTADQLHARKRQVAGELIRRALVAIVAADNVVTDEELEVVCDFARRHEQPHITREQLLHEAAAIRHAEFDALGYLRHVAPQLSELDQEALVYHAFLAATAAGDLSPTRQTLLAHLPAAIGMPEARFREIVSRAVNHR